MEVERIVEPTVLVTGATGTVGRMAVEHLAHESELKRIYISGRKKSTKKGTGISYTGRIDSMLFGGNVDAEWVPCDLLDTEDLTDTLRKIQPGAIYNCTSMISSYWYVPLINWDKQI
jgi:FlaA1/EpsC-like NDP-sugar epimerase